MSEFGRFYSESYDELYGEKNYAAETDYVVTTLGLPANSEILNLGCGTGSHDFLIAKRGFKVVGVDRSNDMLALAEEKKKASPEGKSVEFVRGDVRELQLNRKFDAVISMFGVASYMVENSDIKGYIETAKRHLKPGGKFLFDAWHGAAVLSDPPQVRVRERTLTNGQRLIRFTSPAMEISANRVDVTFRLLRLEGKSVVDETVETHPMRFYFAPELKSYLTNAGFVNARAFPFLRPQQPLTKTEFDIAVVAELPR